MDLLLIFLSFTAFSPTLYSLALITLENVNANQTVNLTEKPNANQTVNVTVVYETYCPDSVRFINSQLWPVYLELKEYVVIELLPYGKASQYYDDGSDRWMFRCQHGPRECIGNLIHSCALLHYPEVENPLQFINCFEGKVRSSFFAHSPQEIGAFCGDHDKMEKEWSGVDWNILEDCVDSREGNEFQHYIGSRTPSIGYVPWIYINGKDGQEVNDRAEQDLKALICEELSDPKPEACA